MVRAMLRTVPSSGWPAAPLPPRPLPPSRLQCARLPLGVCASLDQVPGPTCAS